jgi:hypothetical protein
MGAACRLGISLAAARTYLRHVLDKTGAHHQAELVVLSAREWLSRCGADHADRSDAQDSLVFRGSFTHSFNLAKQRNACAIAPGRRTPPILSPVGDRYGRPPIALINDVAFRGFAPNEIREPPPAKGARDVHRAPANAGR